MLLRTGFPNTVGVRVVGHLSPSEVGNELTLQQISERVRRLYEAD